MNSVLLGIFCISLFVIRADAFCIRDTSVETKYGCFYKGSLYDYYYISAESILPIVKDAFFNQFLTQLARNMCTPDAFWLGATVDYRGQWSWWDGTDLTYTNWAPVEPKNSQQGYCILFDPSTGKWKTENCSNDHPSIGIEYISSAKQRCKDNLGVYSNIMNKCLEVSIGGYERWDDQEKFCEDMYLNSTAVSIHNDFGNIVIYGHARVYDEIFLGIHDPFKNGTFVWYDGSKVDYTNWGIQPPVGSCGVMFKNDSRWYPRACDYNGEDGGAVVCQTPVLP